MTLPAVTPVTIPDEVTVAMLLSSLVQEPPAVPLVNVLMAAAHTVDAPEITPADGDVLIVTPAVAVAVPQPLVIV